VSCTPDRSDSESMEISHDQRADDPFGYGYFDDPTGLGYRGYERDANGDGDYLPWAAARDFCLAHDVRTAVDLGCAKGFLVAELLAHGVNAVGYDVSTYALSFTHGLPCYWADIRDDIPRSAEAVFVLGVLQYVEEAHLPRVVTTLRAATRRFLLFSSYYEGDSQAVPDPTRRTTRPAWWWRELLVSHGFAYVSRGAAFDVYTVC
jgi:SAM-dependent methyltransferase